ncbi:hypothetical protein B0O99DRAFT_684041 [Bisporella sp. PMI_857]|nr:hypothetical protein B0O99DRAFT_684041 [Bisporella sp. PMI_857]
MDVYGNGQPVPPFAVLPGVFEATLGQYLMVVRIQNIWTVAWPPTARVGLSGRCRAWLSAGGVTVIDSWSMKDQEAVGQQVVGGRVVIGRLEAWATRRIFFKVDVSQAAVRKHQVELQVVTDQGAERVALINKAASAPIILRKLGIGSAGGSGGGGGPRGVGGSGGGTRGCNQRTLEYVRAQLRAFLDGKEVDLCALWRQLACCRASGGTGGGGGDNASPGGDWTGTLDPGLTIFLFPTEVDYPDPWWKILLIIVALILTLVAAVSGGVNLANARSDDVIGTLAHRVLNAMAEKPEPPLPEEAGSVDVAVVTLNGNRGLTPAIFTVLDAASGGVSTNPIQALGSQIDTPRTILTNTQIAEMVQNLTENPGDPAAEDAFRVFKSGARSGTTSGKPVGTLVPRSSRGEDDGSTIWFKNKLDIKLDDTGIPLAVKGTRTCSGFEDGSGVTACRIEDALAAVGGARFAQRMW